MNNHNIYETVESGITYKVLSYFHDDDNDYKYLTKFINNNKYCKIIKVNDHYDTNGLLNYHPYYNPGTLISETTYYVDGNRARQRKQL